MVSSHSSDTLALSRFEGAASSIVIAASDLVKIYGRGDGAVTALDHVDLTIERGKFTAIMGPSGSGKSTLMHCLAGLDSITSGSVMLDGEELSRMSERQLTRLRRDKIGFIFQSFNLVPTLSAKENILLPTDIAKRKVSRSRFAQVVSTVGLSDRLSHLPSQLSGGQQQRVACARALVGSPAVVFADEPTGNLDSQATVQVLKFLRQAVDDFQQTVVMVTHEVEAAAWADRVIFLRDGKIASELVDPTSSSVLDALRVLGNNVTLERPEQVKAAALARKRQLAEGASEAAASAFFASKIQKTGGDASAASADAGLAGQVGQGGGLAGEPGREAGGVDVLANRLGEDPAPAVDFADQTAGQQMFFAQSSAQSSSSPGQFAPGSISSGLSFGAGNQAGDQPSDLANEQAASQTGDHSGDLAGYQSFYGFPSDTGKPDSGLLPADGLAGAPSSEPPFGGFTAIPASGDPLSTSVDADSPSGIDLGQADGADTFTQTATDADPEPPITGLDLARLVQMPLGELRRPSRLTKVEEDAYTTAIGMFDEAGRPIRVRIPADERVRASLKGARRPRRPAVSTPTNTDAATGIAAFTGASPTGAAPTDTISTDSASPAATPMEAAAAAAAPTDVTSPAAPLLPESFPVDLPESESISEGQKEMIGKAREILRHLPGSVMDDEATGK